MAKLIPIGKKRGTPKVELKDTDIQLQNLPGPLIVKNDASGWDIKATNGYYTLGVRLKAQKSDFEMASLSVRGVCLREMNRRDFVMPKIEVTYSDEYKAVVISTYGYKDEFVHNKMKAILAKMAKAVEKELTKHP